MKLVLYRQSRVRDRVARLGITPILSTSKRIIRGQNPELVNVKWMLGMGATVVSLLSGSGHCEDDNVIVTVTKILLNE